MATTRETGRVWPERAGRAAEDEAEPVFGIVIWPGAGVDAGEPPAAPAARVRLRDVFAPAAAG